MFYKCSSLTNLPDISKWNTNNIIDMNFVFSGCSNLKTLPDISKWNTLNVKTISYLFSNFTPFFDIFFVYFMILILIKQI